MKKAAIITLYGNNNYGNKLQNYAVQQVLLKFNISPTTIMNTPELNVKKNALINYIKYYIKRFIHNFIIKDNKYTYDKYNNNIERTNNFLEFDRIIKKTDYYFSYVNKKDILKYDYYIVGSDQVWNPYFGLKDYGLLDYIEIDSKKISFSASIGVEGLPKKIEEKYRKNLSKFKSLSMREEKGKEIIEKITNRKDIEVLIDPTMLLKADEWDKVMKKPKIINTHTKKKFILNYFLGELSDEAKKEIQRVADENDCYIINLLDKNDPFYICGPSEFLYLEKNAFLICTDSFHSCVFAIIYNKPFIVFERKQLGVNNMTSRIDTLLNKFNLKNRKYNGHITNINLKCDYSKTFSILEKELNNSYSYIEKSLDIIKK